MIPACPYPLGSSLRKRRSKAPPKPPPPPPRINERIRVPEVRVIDEEGGQVGVLKTADAIVMARERDVDLVEVSGQASPPVARLMDFGRFKYETSKKESEARKHQVKAKLREVRMKPKIDVHDIDFKTRTVEKLLRQGDKVKVTVMFRGREITHPQIGKKLLDRIFDSLEDVSTKEKDASLEGRHMSMILTPDKRGIAARDRAAGGEDETGEGVARSEAAAEAPAAVPAANGSAPAALPEEVVAAEDTESPAAEVAAAEDAAEAAVAEETEAPAAEVAIADDTGAVVEEDGEAASAAASGE